MFSLFKVYKNIYKNDDKIWKKYKNEFLQLIAKILYNSGVSPQSIKENIEYEQIVNSGISNDIITNYINNDVMDALEKYYQNSNFKNPINKISKNNKKLDIFFSKVKDFTKKILKKLKRKEKPITFADAFKKYGGEINPTKQAELNKQFRTIDLNSEYLKKITLTGTPLMYHSKYNHNDDDKQFLENSILSIEDFNNNDFYDKENKFELNKARLEMNKWGNKKIKKAMKEFFKNSDETTTEWNFNLDEDIATHSQHIVNKFCQYLPNNLTARIKNININSLDRLVIINMEFAFKDESDIYVFSSWENLTPYESLLIR